MATNQQYEKEKAKRKEMQIKVEARIRAVKASKAAKLSSDSVEASDDVLPTTSALPVVSESGVGAEHSMNDDERTSFSPNAASARDAKLPNNEESAAAGEGSLPVAKVLLL